MKKLTLGEDKVIAGVCSGIAEYLNVDVTLVRIIYLMLALSPFIPGIIAYFCMWLIIPWHK